MRSLRSGLHQSLLVLLLLLASLSTVTLVSGCSDDPVKGTLTVSIDLAAPSFGHAPLDVSFQVSLPAEDPDAEYEITWDFGDGSTQKGPAAVTHLYTTEGTFEVTVTVVDGSGSEGSDTAEVEVRASADLIVSNVQGQPGQLDSSQPLSVQFNVSNNAAAVGLPFNIVVFLTNNERVDADDVDDLTILESFALDSFGGQDSGGAEDFQRVVSIPSSLPTGDYFLGVVVDSEQTVGELDETNNIALQEIPIRIFNSGSDGADLVVTQVAATPSQTAILSSVTVDTTIENRGQRSAVNFSYAIFLSEDDVFDPEVDTLLIDVPVTGLSVGGVLQESVFVPLPEPIVHEDSEEDYWVFVLVDPRGELPEINDNNNLTASLNPIIVGGGSPDAPDIIVTKLDLDVTDTFVGGSILTTTTVVNQGLTPTGQFLCSVYISEDQVLKLEEDTRIGAFNIFNLDVAGTEDAQRIVDWPVTIGPQVNPGAYWVFVFCDSGGRVVEFDENNNAQRFIDQINIGIESEVDLTVESVSLNPPSPLDSGSDTTITFDVRNSGSTSAGPSIVRVYLSQDTNADPNDAILFESLLPGLGPDTSQTFEAVISVNCLPWIEEYSLLVAADVRNTVAELDDENNTGALEGTLIVNGERCRCINDVVNEPNNFSNVATSLSVGSNTGFALCSGDTDWYTVTLAAGDSLTVSMNYDPSFGVLELALFDPTRGLLEEIVAVDTINKVDTFLVSTPGDYLIQVRPSGSNSRNYYDLDVSLSQRVVGAYDIAAVDIVTSTLTPQLNKTFFVEGSIVNLGDQDLDATNSFFVGVYLSQDRAIDPMSEDVHTLATFVLNGINGEERVRFTEEVILPGNIPSGDWYIGVVADVNDDVPGEADETNNVGISQALSVDTRCYDTLEPNDTTATAATVAPQSMDPALSPNASGLVVCKTNKDVYRIPVEANQQVRVTVDSDVTQGDLDIYLYSQQGVLLGKSETTSDTEEVFVPVVIGRQDLFLEVIQVNSNFNSDRSNYTLTVTAVAADPQLICNPEFEPNDRFEEAGSLFNAAATTQTLATCPDTDKDYYSFYLEAGNTIDITFDTTSTQLRAFLYQNQQTLISSHFNLPTTTISHTAANSGNFFLMISAEPGAAREIEYGINITGDINGYDLLPLNPTMTPTTLSAGDSLFFSFEVINQGTDPSPTYGVIVDIATDMGFGNIVGTFNGPQNLASLGAQATFPVNGKVILPLDLSGPYYARVVLVPSAGATELNTLNNSFSSPINVFAVCLPDDFEGAGTDNNAATRATSATVPDTFSNASVCPGDRDWYSLSLGVSQSITVTATFTQVAGDLNEDIDVFIYRDPAAAPLAQGISVDSDEVISFTSTTAGTYFIQVKGATSASTNSYTLDIQ